MGRDGTGRDGTGRDGTVPSRLLISGTNISALALVLWGVISVKMGVYSNLEGGDFKLRGGILQVERGYTLQ